VGVPRLRLALHPNLISIGSSDTVQVEVTDQRGRARVTDVDVDVLVSVVGGGMDDVLLTVPAGQSRSAKAVMQVSRGGSLQFVASERHSSGIGYAPDTAIGIIRYAERSVSFSQGSMTVGVSQRADATITRTPAATTEATPFAAASLTGRAAVAATGAFNPLSANHALQVVGTAAGVDTISVSADTYAGDSIRVVVTPGRLAVTGLSSAVKVSTGYTVRIATTDSTGAARSVDADTEFSIAIDDGLLVTNADGVVITRITVPAGASQSETFTVKATKTGTLRLVISRLDYVPVTMLLTAS